MTYPSVTIADTARPDARLIALSVSQALNERWWAVVSCAQTADRLIPVAQWLGAPLTVTSVDETGAACDRFAGFVLTGKPIYRSSGTFSAVLTAVSKTWLLDQAMRKRSSPEQGSIGFPSSRFRQGRL